MSERSASTAWALSVAVAGIAFLLAAQVAAGAFATTDGSSATGRTLGHAGFAYLGGLRTFAAALLWDRLDGIHDGYYQGVTLKDQKFLLPTFRMVTWLDPQFVQAYYVAQWIVARNGRVDEALALTREGLAANPHSGLLRASYAEMLLTFKKERETAHRWAVIAIGTDSNWASSDEKYEGYAFMRDIFKITGDKRRLAVVDAELARLRSAPQGVSPGASGLGPGPGAGRSGGSASP